MEELSLCFRWLKDSKPEEHFLQVIHITRTDAETITSAITAYTWEKRELLSNVCEGWVLMVLPHFQGN